MAKRGAEVDPVSGRSRIHAHPRPRNVHRASSCVTASTHPFEWVVGSPHESQSARAHHSSGFSKESVIPGDDGHENRPSGRPQSRTRAVVRARRGRDHPGSPRATRTMRPDARSGLISPTAPTAPIPPCPDHCSHSIFRLVWKVGCDFWLVAWSSSCFQAARGPPDSSLRPAETGDSTDSIFPDAEITPATSEHALEHASQRGLVTPNAPSASPFARFFGAFSRTAASFQYC